MIKFQAHHMNVTAADLAGNGKIGRYIFLTGSDHRAQVISTHFSNVKTKSHPRQHNFYSGTLSTKHGDIDVASISSGMGGPSADIIITELILLGAKRILRIGTAGSLQVQQVRIGDIVIANAAIRDDKATWDYIYPEFPAVASLEYVISALRAADELHKNPQVHCGIVESKSTLYGREMGYSFLPENKNYNISIGKAGVLATEMECAQLFILAQIHNGRQKALASPRAQAIQVGAILSIISDNHPFTAKDSVVAAAVESSVELGLETVRQVSYLDKLKRTLIG